MAVDRRRRPFEGPGRREILRGTEALVLENLDGLSILNVRVLEKCRDIVDGAEGRPFFPRTVNEIIAREFADFFTEESDEFDVVAEPRPHLGEAWIGDHVFTSEDAT